jgi:hypothetical protein
MSNDSPIPTPANKPTLVGLLKALAGNAAVQHAFNTLISLLFGLAVSYFGLRPAPQVIEVEKAPANDGPPIVYQTGWKPDPEAKAAFIRTLKYPLFATTPAGAVDVPSDAEVFLWKYAEQAWAKYNGSAKTTQRYPNIDQGNAGICVGGGSKHAEDVLTAALQEYDHAIEGWEPIAVEAIYAESRMVGRRKMGERQWQRQMAGKDGSNGSWAAEAATTAGNLVMQPYDGADLSRLDPARAQTWGESGVPAKLQPLAKQKLVKHATQVKSWEDCRRALAQRYTIILCSSVGFNKPNTKSGYVNPGTRDANGFIKPNGRWDHCMALIGMQGGDHPGGFILNSWGDKAHAGPVGKGDPPVAGFWADANVIDQMCSAEQSECYAFSGFDGFPARKLEWSEITRIESPSRSRWLDAPFALAP